jgi:hypothetical protein
LRKEEAEPGKRKRKEAVASVPLSKMNGITPVLQPPGPLWKKARLALC